MPELPEVEVTRLGLSSRLIGRTATSVTTRVAALRYPLPPHLAEQLRGRVLQSIRRRGKYLLFDFGNGHLLIHLGMSGSLRLVRAGEPAAVHDHLDIGFGREVLRLRDPRRFGAALWLEDDPNAHPLLARLGMEPLVRGFTAAALAVSLRGRRIGIKPAIMDAGIVVGVGNIYASESLHLAGIDPRTAAGRVSMRRLERLVPAIKKTLRAAIRAGGSSLRDYVSCEGGLGDFQTHHRVYGRVGEPCLDCGTPVKMLRQGGRATYYCPHCQR
ncbi:MAG: bifunctional DNA-formamidopyrimidine glycosylase/DNA-(apurinic or apyrimidinic site) lyase [Gammaproteobacteria bacterium]|nr:bifunctional DNA-formamidopyrimidine glycosylase/DNA-(apurinic or apyrimidinic site) lyase [Gammaproteobacteria bacterium]MBU1416333.1 bifunctional DNA-formamidopyrimidine glycosylase/DNA-(apurinic or apyrimidinic site) lyase [Gammaproteobacteria bacterium]